MSYPRMNKDDYPPMPKVVNTEEEFALVSEYIVFAATQIKQMQHKCKNPLLNDEQRQKQGSTVEAAMIRYDSLCLLLDDYNKRNPIFSHKNKVNKLKGVLK